MADPFPEQEHCCQASQEAARPPSSLEYAAWVMRTAALGGAACMFARAGVEFGIYHDKADAAHSAIWGGLAVAAAGVFTVMRRRFGR